MSKLFWGHYSQHSRISESMLESPYYGKLLQEFRVECGDGFSGAIGGKHQPLFETLTTQKLSHSVDTWQFPKIR